MRRAVIRQLIIEHMHVFIRHDDHTRSRGDRGNNISRRRKITRIIVENLIAIDAGRMSANLRQIRQVKHQNPARIILCPIIVNICPD